MGYRVSNQEPGIFCFIGKSIEFTVVLCKNVGRRGVEPQSVFLRGRKERKSLCFVGAGYCKAGSFEIY